MHRHQTPRPKRGPACLQLETLEDRCCPSIALQGTTLNVSGTASHDQIIVRDGGRGNVAVTMTDAQGHRSSRIATGVKQIVINSQEGNDRIDYALTAVLTTSEQIVINAGAGKNQINLNFGKGVSAPSLSVQVLAGAGEDNLSASFGSIVNTNLSFSANLGNGFDHYTAALLGNVTGKAKVALALTGGTDFNGLSIQQKGNIGSAAQVSLTAKAGGQSSTVRVDYAGKLDGKLTVQALGSSSFDWINTNIKLTVGSVGSLTVRENGGLNNDVLFLMVHAQGSRLKLLDALVIGGGGTDYSKNTSNVRTQGISA